MPSTNFCQNGSEPKPSSPTYIDINTGFLCSIFEATGWFCPLIDKLLPTLPLPDILDDPRIPNKWGQLAKAFKRLNNAYNLINDIIDITKKVIPTADFCSVEPEEITAEDNVTFDETMSAIIGIQPGADIFWDKMAKISARLLWDKYCRCKEFNPPTPDETPHPDFTCTLPTTAIDANATVCPGRCGLALMDFWNTYLECRNAYVLQYIKNNSKGKYPHPWDNTKYVYSPQEYKDAYNSNPVTQPCKITGYSQNYDVSSFDYVDVHTYLAAISQTLYETFPDGIQNWFTSNWSSTQLARMISWYDNTDNLYYYYGNPVNATLANDDYPSLTRLIINRYVPRVPWIKFRVKSIITSSANREFSFTLAQNPDSSSTCDSPPIAIQFTSSTLVGYLWDVYCEECQEPIPDPNDGTDICSIFPEYNVCKCTKEDVMKIIQAPIAVTTKDTDGFFTLETTNLPVLQDSDLNDTSAIEQAKFDIINALAVRCLQTFSFTIDPIFDGSYNLTNPITITSTGGLDGNITNVVSQAQADLQNLINQLADMNSRWVGKNYFDGDEGNIVQLLRISYDTANQANHIIQSWNSKPTTLVAAEPILSNLINTVSVLLLGNRRQDEYYLDFKFNNLEALIKSDGNIDTGNRVECDNQSTYPLFNHVCIETSNYNQAWRSQLYAYAQTLVSTGKVVGSDISFAKAVGLTTSDISAINNLWQAQTNVVCPYWFVRTRVQSVFTDITNIIMRRNSASGVTVKITVPNLFDDQGNIIETTSNPITVLDASSTDDNDPRTIIQKKLNQLYTSFKNILVNFGNTYPHPPLTETQPSFCDLIGLPLSVRNAANDLVKPLNSIELDAGFALDQFSDLLSDTILLIIGNRLIKDGVTQITFPDVFDSKGNLNTKGKISLLGSGQDQTLKNKENEANQYWSDFLNVVSAYIQDNKSS